MEEVALQTQWGVPVALYLFLGGLAAGTLCVSAVINLKTKDRFKKTLRFGAWSGTLLLIVGVLFLLIETSMPFRAVLLWKSFVNPQSWMTIGAWLLVAGIVLAGLYALSHTERIAGKLRFLKKIRFGLTILIIPVSVGIAIYTGILLGVLVSHPLWHTWLLPALFTVSALDTGVALVLGYAVLREPKEKPKFESLEKKENLEEPHSIKDSKTPGVEPKELTEVEMPKDDTGVKQGLEKLKMTLERTTIILICLEAIVLVAFLLTVASGGGVAQASVQLLVTGALSIYFWILFVGLGLMTPLVLSILLVVKRGLSDKAKNVISLAGIVLCLAGGCALRFLILLAGLPVHI